eukprot:UN24879
MREAFKWRISFRLRHTPTPCTLSLQFNPEKGISLGGVCAIKYFSILEIRL